MRLIYIFIFTLCFTLEIFGGGTLPYALDAKLKPIRLNQNSYSIHIQEVGSDKPIASWNSHKKRSPASVVKLLTTYSGLLELGYDYRWETKFYHTGYIRNGVLKGDLYVKASGDPTLKTADIAPIVSQIKRAGIQKILGNIIIDRSIFEVSNKNNSGFDRNRHSPYNAMPDALMFNKRKSTICVTTRGRRVSINKDVPDQSYRVVNKLKIVNGSCRGNRSWPRVGIKTDNSGRSTITLSGKLSKRCGKRTICKVVGRPYRAFYYALKNKLNSRGVKFKGTLKIKKVPNKASYLFSHKSDKLEDVISVIAKKSDNLMARQLMLTLGASQYPAPSTPYKSRKAIERILNRYSILERGTTYVANGSGLSRESKLTAQSLANLLEHGAINYGQRWMDTLAIAGVDGTIRRRFRNSSVYGRAWMKTGTIKRVSNIAGYVEGASGQKYVVVVLVNDKRSSRYGRKLANIVIKWVADTL
ncbi:D-alanyl-D-alanine carboxypeptidase/D-alanyl-D-alanine-endopeptidase [Sulfurovum sp. bin170]|uniref:D-alanyl-D-alanine carboxypeptidase/D-alanyl-D-alanine endopeptidase n=1 Tax=Sulfurovum sp. bin170 TaxID=2695268 RepID=UPI0013E07469|nr:D-alanyl-D-alanine carboxypeptidase/D-alanyl-D-alanine-endopeptidase [Sulfurovum sp. bin170]NEW59931.1 D-alanyl-D-alanine carboxypeptidase/D-alanyl-D-alanine-endopeptidase [Sulfurovum sp. bin170]